MFSLTKQVFMVLLSFSSSLATECLSLNNELSMIRSSHQRCSIWKVFLEISQNLQKNRPQACNFVIKETLAQVFPVNFAKFLRTRFYRTPPDDCFCMVRPTLTDVNCTEIKCYPLVISLDKCNGSYPKICVPKKNKRHRCI